MRGRHVLRMSARWFLAFFLFGCSTDEADYRRELQAFLGAADDTEPQLLALPDAFPAQAFHYSAYDKRDPFVPPKANRVEGPMRNQEPLEAYPLDTLRMVGTLAKKGERWAIIKVSSDGSIHAVRVGSYIGKNAGRVVAITDTEVRLVETIAEAGGSAKERPTSMVLTTEPTLPD